MRIRIIATILLPIWLASCNFIFDLSLEPFQVTPTLETSRISATLTPLVKPPSVQPLTPQPSFTPIPANTPLSQIFRDDFTGVLQPGWTLVNEVPERWKITSTGWLQIVAQDPSNFDGKQSNLLCRTAPVGDYQVSIHLYADPVSDYQQATLYIYQDHNNYIAINRGYCGPCGGNAIFMEYKLAGTVKYFSFKTKETDLYLRLVNAGNTVTAYYALDKDDWQRLGRISNFLDQPRVCLGASNCDIGTYQNDLVANFDYIEITRP